MMKKYGKNLPLLTLFLICSFSLFSCSVKLPPETLPSFKPTEITVTETEVTETAEITTEPTETEPLHGPFSTASVTDMPVEINGNLSVSEAHMVNENGDTVVLRGMSSYCLPECGDFFNADTVKTLAEDWGCDVLRISNLTSGSDSYESDPEGYFVKVCDIIDLCIEQGIYIIVDWHITVDGDPNEHIDEAADFFGRISALYGEYPNVIYEICNEPDGLIFDAEPEDNEGEDTEEEEEVEENRVNWVDSIVPYAEEITEVIRENDEDNMILVGTPDKCTSFEDVIENPLEDANTLYVFHFYAAEDKQEQIDNVMLMVDAGLPLFCSEWDTCSRERTGEADFETAELWLTFMDENQIGWCNGYIGSSVTETANALKYMSNILTDEEKAGGHWPDEFISASGLFVRCHLLGIPYESLEN